MLSVFPGSERLRYLIPFGSPEQIIEYLAKMSETHPNAVAVFGDDGEKFGTWPGTRKHVYDDGWLVRFFDALVQNQNWIQVTTLAEALDNVPPVGKIFLPDCSYREMTEWALPVERLVEYQRIEREMRDDPRWNALRPFVRGGFWRNFRVKYPEADEMYCRMMSVSRRLQETLAAAAAGEPVNTELVEQARIELYRGQCNCGYWHGAFGGIYLPHLRNAVYQHLIAADNLLDRAVGRPETWVEAVADDFNFDARQEVRLTNDKLMALVSPSRGGQMIELDVRRIQHNLLATLARRPEAYHEKVRAGEHQNGDQVASIHERVVFKQPNLQERLQYDDHARKSLVDLFYDNDATLEAVASGAAPQRGDFLGGNYEARIRRNPDRIQVQMLRDGNAWGIPLRITKGLTLDAGSSTLQVAYLLENLPQGRPLHFAVEFNFAGLPANVDGRYFSDIDGRTARPTRRKARPQQCLRPEPDRRVAGHRRGPEDVAAHQLLDLPHRDGEPIGGRVRVGPSVGGGDAALAGRGRQGRPLERDDADVAGHQPRREPPQQPSPKKPWRRPCNSCPLSLWERVRVRAAAPGERAHGKRGRDTLSSPLKKGTGSELASENPAENDGREVPVPFFNGLLSRRRRLTAARLCGKIAP